MKQQIIIASIFLLTGSTDNQKKTSTAPDRLELNPKPEKKLKEEHLQSKAGTQMDTISCDNTPLEFLKLMDKHIKAGFFQQLDSIRKVQYSKNDQDTDIFVDLTPKLLDKFLKDLNKDQLAKTGNFEKEYNFNIAPKKYKDSKECKDKISITYDKKYCGFRLVIYNEFFAEWCQESTVVYGFKINGDRIYDFSRNEAG
jgi:hypothetical protein